MIYYFNPGHETAVMNGSPYYTAPANLVHLQNDLSYLVALYASADDYIFTDNPLPKSFRRFINENLFPFPKTITMESIQSQRNDIKGRKVNLWGISPQSIHFFQELNQAYTLDLDIPMWNLEYLKLCSRQMAKDCLELIIEKCPEISSNIQPNFYTEINDIEKQVMNSKKQLLAKAPYSSSGRGLLWLPLGNITQTERQILHGFIKKQGCVSIEYVLDKHVDFAMEFNCNSGNVSFEGLSLFETNSKGGYSRNILAAQNEIEDYLGKFISLNLLEKVKSEIIKYLSQKYATVYDGYIGVDMMVYKKNNTYNLHPCVEINMRSNMGIIAINICRKVIDPKSQGYFQIDFEATNGEMLTKHKKMMLEYPHVFEKGKLKEGYLSLCPINTNSKYRAYVIIDCNSETILR